MGKFFLLKLAYLSCNADNHVKLTKRWMESDLQRVDEASRQRSLTAFQRLCPCNGKKGIFPFLV